MSETIVKYVLLTTYLIMSRPLKWWFKIRSKLANELLYLTKGRYLIIANHQRKADPYLILATLPFSVFKKLTPIRFFTANVYLEHWWQRVFLMPFGCFRAYSVKNKISGLKAGLDYAGRGNTLFIFPQGKRAKDNLIDDLKVGVGYLTQKKDFIILPASIEYKNGEVVVTWGKPFKPDQKDRLLDLSKSTEKIFAHVLKLYGKLP